MLFCFICCFTVLLKFPHQGEEAIAQRHGIVLCRFVVGVEQVVHPDLRGQFHAVPEGVGVAAHDVVDGIGVRGVFLVRGDESPPDVGDLPREEGTLPVGGHPHIPFEAGHVRYLFHVGAVILVHFLAGAGLRPAVIPGGRQAPVADLVVHLPVEFHSLR